MYCNVLGHIIQIVDYIAYAVYIAILQYTLIRKAITSSTYLSLKIINHSDKR